MIAKTIKDFRNYIKNIDSLTFFLCLVWGRDLLGYANAVFLRIPLLKEVGEYAAEIILVIALLFCLRRLSKYITQGTALFYLFFLVAYVFTYVMFPQNSDFLDANAICLLTVLPFIFVGRTIDIDKLAKPFYVISFFYIVWRFFVIIFLKRDEREMGEFADYNMAAAYIFLPHLLMVTWHFLQKINILDAVGVVIGIIVLLGFGTRGPVFCLIVFVGLYFLFARSFKRRLLSTIIIIIVGTLAIVYVNSVFDVLSSATSYLSLSNRIFNQYEEGMLNSDSGRGLIQNTVLSATQQSGFFGLGICGDRVATGDNYSHNLVVEIIASFGYTIGSLLIISLVILTLLAWRRCGTQDRKGFFLVLLSYNLHLLLSSSYLQTPLFFFYIGFCVRLLQEKSKDIIYDKGNKVGRAAYLSQSAR